jgi:hypothetical protein
VRRKMLRRTLPMSLAVLFASLCTHAADNLKLKSVNVELPAGDRMFPKPAKPEPNRIR